MVQQLGWGSIVYLLSATRWTLLLAVVGMIGGGMGGLWLAMLSTSRPRLVRLLVAAIIQAVEGIPLLMLLFMTYFGLGLFGYRLDPWIAVSAALIIYASAFLGDIWSGSIRTVPNGQWEGANSLALSRADALRFVILPQAVRIAVPPTVGFLVQLIKGTALASMVGFVELTRSGQILNNLTFQPFTIYLLVAAFYFCMCWPLSMLSRRLERRLASPFKR